MMAPDNLLAALRKPPQADRDPEAGEHDPGAIATMLAALDPTEFGKGQHQRWFALMCSVHHASGGAAEDAFVEWSTSDPRYAGDEAIIRQRWRSLSLEAPNANTSQLFAELQAAGRDDLIPQPKAGHLFADLTDADFAFHDPAKRSANDNMSDQVAPERSDGAPLDPLSRLGALTVGQFGACYQPPDMLLDGVIALGTVTVVSGEPGSGKSFWALGLAAAVAFGAEEFCGTPVLEHGPVLVAALEGQGVIAHRVQAACQYHRLPVTDALRIVGADVSLLPADENGVKRLRVMCKALRPRLVIIDTFSQAVAGADTDREQHVAAAVKIANEIASRYGAAVIIIHHPPKSLGSAVRGSGVLIGNVDAVYRFLKEDSASVLDAEKVRWGRMPPPIAYQLRDVDLLGGPEGFLTDKFGRVISSAVMVRAEGQHVGVKPSMRSLVLASLKHGQVQPDEKGVYRRALGPLAMDWRKTLGVAKSSFYDQFLKLIPAGETNAIEFEGWTLWYDEGVKLPDMKNAARVICGKCVSENSNDDLSDADIA